MYSCYYYLRQIPSNVIAGLIRAYFTFWHAHTLPSYPADSICQLLPRRWLLPALVLLILHSVSPQLCRLLCHGLIIWISVCVVMSRPSGYRVTGDLCFVRNLGVPCLYPLLTTPLGHHMCRKYSPQFIICLFISFVALLCFLLHFTGVLNICCHWCRLFLLDFLPFSS